jgi:iron complex transport system substrate-binding protein
MGRVKATVFVILLVLSLERNTFSFTFVDEVGQKVEWNTPPQRIISLAPSVTEILFAIGLGERIVGVSSYCNYPPQALSKEKVGGYTNPSLEKIIALKPHLVIGTADGELKPFVRKMKEMGISVYITNPQSVADVLTTIQNIGEVTSAQTAAEEVVAAMKKKIQNVKEKVQGRSRVRVLNVLAHDPLITSGRGTFVDDLISLAGGFNIAGQTREKHPRFSMEEVIARDPEVILLSSMTSQDPLTGQLQWWARWKEISAVRLGRIYVLDADLIHRPSPRIADGLEEMAKVIHPETLKDRIQGSKGPRDQEFKNRGRGFEGARVQGAKSKTEI